MSSDRNQQKQYIKDRMLYCLSCKYYCAHKFHDIENGSWSDDETGRSGEYHYYSVNCGNCQTTLFLTRSYCSEDIDSDSDDYNYAEKYFIPVEYEDKEIKLVMSESERKLVPAIINNVLDEIECARMTQSWVMWGMGVRMALEAIMAECKVAGGNLNQKINSFITSRSTAEQVALGDFLQAVHDIRLFGNDSAHELEPVPQTQRCHLVRLLKGVLEIAILTPNRHKELAAISKQHPQNYA